MTSTRCTLLPFSFLYFRFFDVEVLFSKGTNNVVNMLDGDIHKLRKSLLMNVFTDEAMESYLEPLRSTLRTHITAVSFFHFFSFVFAQPLIVSCCLVRLFVLFPVAFIVVDASS